MSLISALDQFALHRASAIDNKIDTLHLELAVVKEMVERQGRDIRAIKEHQTATLQQMAALRLDIANLELLILSLRARIIP